MGAGDLVKRQFDDEYNMEACKLQAAVSVPAASHVLGYPVIVAAGVAVIQTAAQVTAFTGTSTVNVVCDDNASYSVFSGTPSVEKYRVGRRGPLTVHKKALKTLDPAGAAYDMAKFEAALLVAGIVVVDEVGTTSQA
jgi:hypothetical protein